MCGERLAIGTDCAGCAAGVSKVADTLGWAGCDGAASSNSAGYTVEVFLSERADRLAVEGKLRDLLLPHRIPFQMPDAALNARTAVSTARFSILKNDITEYPFTGLLPRQGPPRA
jgi:hypothetical protein